MKYLTHKEHHTTVLILIILFSPLMIALLYTKSFVLAGLLWAFLAWICIETLPKKEVKTNEDV